MDLQLSEKFCLVTGASAGIGTAIAKSLAEEGARLIITARRQELLNAVAEDIAERAGNMPLTISADLMDEQAPEAIRAFVEEQFGGIDILINNAGLSSPPNPMAPDDVWDAGFDLKFTTVRRLTNAFMPQMRARGWGRLCAARRGAWRR